ncbi:putative membrane protein [Opitutaceae bacterium TAV1]|nr:putative membrane protein [Opitutaceae bacterium TAV1]
MNRVIRTVFSTRASNWAALPVRLAVGSVMFAHGAQKLLGWWGGKGLQATAEDFANGLGLSPGILWASLAAGGEFFGGAALVLGLATRFFGLVTGCIMAVAIATAHSKGYFAPSGMEYPLTLLLGSLSLILSGGGALSADALFFRKRTTTITINQPAR